MDIARKRRPPRATYSRKPTVSASTTPASTSPPHAAKRRRLADGSDSRSSSVPTTEAEDIAAPDPPEPDTPVSSSPPAPPSPLPAKKKPLFTFFARTTTTTPSALRRPTPTTSKPKPKPKPKNLTQMTIDLGQPLRLTCRTCGMSYHPSTPDDDALHKRFHAKSIGGVDFALKSLKEKDKRVVWKADEGDGYVLMVDSKATSAEKRKAKEVLEVADSELGAAEIEEDVLWGVGGRFKVYLYVLGKKCVGLCLAERIEKAYKVLDDTKPEEEEGNGGPVSIGDVAQPALLGIARIWTCSSHRRQGIAARLLECARGTFIYGMQLEKGMVAFSQPTESGSSLARRWFDVAQGEEAYRREEGGVRGEGEGDEGKVRPKWAIYVEKT